MLQLDESLTSAHAKSVPIPVQSAPPQHIRPAPVPSYTVNEHAMRQSMVENADDCMSDTDLEDEEERERAAQRKNDAQFGEHLEHLIGELEECEDMDTTMYNKRLNEDPNASIAASKKGRPRGH